ncbi:hypothetical protein [Variovorax paradoxus]|uniref:hypothetical protein n=1 Tax=Variovorax paradoxus TaxID=34073 RepID=UPI003ECCF2B0
MNGLLTPRCKWWEAAGEHLLMGADLWASTRRCGLEGACQNRRAAHPVRRPEKMSQAKGNA